MKRQVLKELIVEAAVVLALIYGFWIADVTLNGEPCACDSCVAKNYKVVNPDGVDLTK